MIKLFIKKFIKSYDDTSDSRVREKYGVLSGVLGIICNIFLFALKLSLGIIMNSIAIISDAFNNLSDMGSSLITIIGTKLSNKKPDREHPFGHGRLEYVSSLIVAFIIMLVGIELFKSSVEKLLNPSPIEFQWYLCVILSISVFVKLWMFSYNTYIGRKINSQIISATAKDSINDAFATFAVIISSIIGVFTSFPVDALAGIAVSVLIIIGGFKIARETVGTLLGTPPTKELVNKLSSYITAPDEILGIHDLIVHDYGPGRKMASVHAEVADNEDIIKIHEIIDYIEQKVSKELDLHLVIHMDPIAVSCEKTNSFKQITTDIVLAVNPEFSIHDFRFVDGENRINLIFDLVIPASFNSKAAEAAITQISQALKQKDSRFCAVISVDYKYYD